MRKFILLLKKYEFIVTWLGIIITIITLFTVDQKINNFSYIIKQEKNDKSIDSNVNSFGDGDDNISINDVSDSNITIDKSINSNFLNTFVPDNGMSQIDYALSMAECYYCVGEYGITVDIYESILSKENNSIALCNLGYMYANGLGTEKDDAKAYNLYSKAIILGCERAETNRLALLLNNRYYERAECLKQLIENKNTIVMEFVLSNYKLESKMTQEEYINHIINMKNDDMIEYINENMYEMIDKGVEKFATAPTDDALTRYERVGSYNFYNESDGVSGTVLLYRKYIIKCKNIKLLREGFLYSFE